MFVVTEDWYFVSHRLPLAEAARKAGFDVAVATQVDKHGDRIKAAGLMLVPVSFKRSGLRPLAEAITLGRLLWTYLSWRPDIAHHVALKPVLYGSIAARIAGIHGVVNALGGLGYVFRSSKPLAKVLRTIVKPFLRLGIRDRNARFIVQNEDDGCRIVQDGLALPDAVRLIRGSGVELGLYRRAVQDTEVPLVIFPARLLRDKGVVEFVEAARKLQDRGVRARFALVGKPDAANPTCIEQNVLEGWIDDRSVEFWGWQEDMPSVFSHAQIVCLPSYHEGLPKVLLEAAASGCAMVASDIPGCCEIVHQGRTGWLVPPRDSDQLAEALQEAINRPDLRRKYAQAAHMLVEAEFSVGRVIAETLAVYDELLRDCGTLPNGKAQ